jgi:TonB-linked SusC/RagA family outer membrane protein
MSKFLLACFSFVLLSFSVMAQDRVVQGKVTSQEDGMPLPGVNVVVKGTTSGAVTDADGKYSVSVKDADVVLVFTSIGFASKEELVGERTIIDVILDSDITQLSEVVVTAFGDTKKTAFTGSSGYIGSEAIALRPITNLASSIAGSTAGVTVSAGSGLPGSTPAIRIRGFGSVNASSAPLYVVDGVPYGLDISGINPSDIESITPLKDAASTALYGSRAANGVIMVTTKKGKSGKASINFKYTKGFNSRAIPEYERVGPADYYPLMWEINRNPQAYGASPVPLATANANASANLGSVINYNVYDVPFAQLVDVNGNLNPQAKLLYKSSDLDWQEPLIRQGTRDEVNLTMSGGNDKSDFFISAGYLKDVGFLIKSDFERYTARANFNSKMTDWMKAGINTSVTVTNSNQNNGDGGTSFVNPFFFGRTLGPIFPYYAYDPANPGSFLLGADGNRIYDYGNLTALGLPARPQYAGRHVIHETKLNVNGARRNQMVSRGYAEVNFLKDFKFTINAGLDFLNRNDRDYGNNLIGDSAPSGATTHEYTNTFTFNLNQLLNYSKSFGSHNVSVLVGHESFDFRTNNFFATRIGQVVEGNIELTNFGTLTDGNGSQDRRRVEGYFSRINYDFNERYFVSVSARRDASSRFSKDARWGTFYSVSGAWRLDQEDFIKNIPLISQLKLRASYGQTGNEDILDSDGNTNYYPYQALFNLGWNNAGEPGILQTSLGNSALTWETNNQTDVGLEFGIMKNRIIGTVEYFNRKSTDMLFDVPLPYSQGLTSVTQNIGEMYNRGVEVTIGADVLNIGGFVWHVDANATKMKNEITKLPTETPTIISGTKQLKVGHSIFDYWLREYIGVRPETGEALYRAATYNTANSFITEIGDTLTTSINNARFHYNGSAIPKIQGGFTNTFSYKGVSLSAVVVYQIGGKVYDGAYQGIMSAGGYGTAKGVAILRRWQNPGDITDIPRMDQGRTADFDATSDRWLVDASYLNLRSVTLSYTLPKKWVTKVFLSNAQFFVSGENFYIKSRRIGMNAQQAFTGVTSNTFTPAKSVVFGASITL